MNKFVSLATTKKRNGNDFIVIYMLFFICIKGGEAGMRESVGDMGGMGVMGIMGLPRPA